MEGGGAGGRGAPQHRHAKGWQPRPTFKHAHIIISIKISYCGMLLVEEGGEKEMLLAPSCQRQAALPSCIHTHVAHLSGCSHRGCLTALPVLHVFIINVRS